MENGARYGILFTWARGRGRPPLQWAQFGEQIFRVETRKPNRARNDFLNGYTLHEIILSKRKFIGIVLSGGGGVITYFRAKCFFFRFSRLSPNRPTNTPNIHRYPWWQPNKHFHCSSSKGQIFYITDCIKRINRYWD